ncbi:MAG: DUF4389 domain-containing protein [Dehalococcoidia bacterium]
MSSAPASYPITLDIAPPAPQSRLTVLFRILMVIPHQIVLYFLQIAAQVITLIAWFAILFTGKYPAGMYGFVVGYLRWSSRVGAYTALLTGTYPPFALDDSMAYPVRLSVQPQLEGRNRLTVFFRIFMIIPHVIVLYLVAIVAILALVAAWFVALFTGSVPEGIHNFLAGVSRWSTRVNGYALLLTDEYPPFSLS